jgi:hypothetical protein
MEKQKYEHGATRSALTERYDLIPKAAMDALARRLGLGAAQHGENNWRGGGEKFRKATLNHLMRHLLDYIENGNARDANSDAIICNAAFLCYFEAQEPFNPRGLPPEVVEALLTMSHKTIKPKPLKRPQGIKPSPRKR